MVFKAIIIGWSRYRKKPAGQRPATTIVRMESLEQRLALSVNALSYHGNDQSTGVNAMETELSPSNVKTGSFGKLFAVPLDGNVYAEPLVDTGVTITSSAFTTNGAAGVHDVVYVATENDTLYAIDASVVGGAILWKRSFLDTSVAANNTLGASSIQPVSSTDVSSTDITPSIGITGTPVIDPSTNTLYVSVATKETIGGVTHFVQRLHAINITNGTDRVTPFLIGDTSNGNTNNTPIYVYGTGDGEVTDPYNNTGKDVVQFNALRENQRMALSLVNNTVYVSWASHGDQTPYHGWIAAWDVSNLTTKGMVLKGVFNDSPNGGQAGIWQGGGQLAFETDGSAFYVETGNGPGGHGNPTLNAAGFPSDASYYDAAIKIVADPTTTATNQNPNGWGMKVADYFIPYNQVALDNADRDFGAAGPILLPASAGIPGHPNLLIAAGKEGKIYVIDRDNMGKFSATGDNVLNAVANGSGNNTPPVALDGEFNTGAFYNGTLYWTPGYDSNTAAFQVNSNGTLTETSQTSEVMGTQPGSIMVSANGTTNGIVWVMDRNANEIHAYNANSLSTELWNSGQKAGDSLGAVEKFAVPTIVNGEVYVGTTNSLVVYGLTPPSTSVPAAPVLAAAAVSGTAVNLSWTDSTLVPNTAAGYLIEDSTDGTNFTQITTAPGGSTAISIGGLSALTKYYFRIRGYNSLGDSNYSNIVNATTSNSVATIDFSGGFAAASAALALNGSAALSGSNLVLTNGGRGEAGSAFFKSPVDVSKFTTQFNFQLSAGTSIADGFTFTIQAAGLTALGANGGGLGYGINPNGTGSSIGKSVAIKFDLYSNSGEGNDSTGLFTNGATPTTAGSINLTSTGVNLQSGDPFQVNMSYDGTTLTVVILDTKTGKSATQTYTVNIPSFTGGSMAYVGFTGGTGGLTSTQSILSWTFSPNAAQSPNAPAGLGATPATATSVFLSWTNTAGNQTGYHLDRATDVNFTQNLITQTLPASPSSFTDTVTGLGPGQTYYYRLRAFNTAGDSANSNTTMVTIPLAPPTPTGATVTNVTSSEIDLSWTDNAGAAATGYLILRGANGGNLVPYANLPAEGDAPPIQYTWSDKNVTPGTAYEYHIEAVNTSGNNDFTGTNADTLTLPPGNVVATPANGSVTLTWTAPTDAVEYNIYRGSSPGTESATPYATVTTGTTFTDNSVTNGTKYYYKVTALNPNINHVPAIPAESAASTEVSATPGTVVPPTGFSGFSNLKLNGSAQLSGSALELTNGSSAEAASAFTSSTFSVAKFTTSFDFQLTSATADGFTFTLQGVGPTALGMNGGGLGYSTDGSHTGPTITKSVAIKFDLASNQGEGSDSTGLYLNGASPTNVGSIDLTNTGINLHSGDAFNVYLSYDGTTLTQTITDNATKAVFTHSYTVNIPSAVGGSLGYVGFTAGTGRLTAVQKILDWTYTPLA